MITLTTSHLLGSATKWQILDVQPNDTNAVAYVTIVLLNATNLVVSQKTIAIHDGTSDKLDFTTPQVGQSLQEALLFSPSALSTPTGYTDAVNAWRAGGATAALRRTALEAHLLSVGYMGSTLAGS